MLKNRHRQEESLSPTEKTRHISDSSILTIDRVESGDVVQNRSIHQISEIENLHVNNEHPDLNERKIALEKLALEPKLELELEPSAGNIHASIGAQIDKAPSNLSPDKDELQVEPKPDTDRNNNRDIGLNEQQKRYFAPSIDRNNNFNNRNNDIRFLEIDHE
jgi:hypothetical protein